MVNALEESVQLLPANVGLPTGCATCATFRYRHCRRRRLIKTAQMKRLQISHPSTLQEVTRPSPRRFSSTTSMNVPTKGGPVAMSLRVWLFRPYRLCQNELTPMPGWPVWIRSCICGIKAAMAAWIRKVVHRAHSVEEIERSGSLVEQAENDLPGGCFLDGEKLDSS